MSYQDKVKAAAAALQRGEDANWELAELTFEVCGPPMRGPTRVGFVSLEEWSADVRADSKRAFSAVTAGYYRRIWDKFGVSRSGKILPSWTDAYNDIRGVENMDANMVTTNFNRALTYATPEQKREVFQRIVREEPAVVEHAWQDTDTNIALSTAHWKARQQIVEEQRQAQAAVKDVFEPRDSPLDHSVFFLDVGKKIDQWTRELNSIREFLGAVQDVNFITRDALRGRFKLLIHAAEECRDALSDQPAEDVVEASPRPRRNVLAS